MEKETVPPYSARFVRRNLLRWTLGNACDRGLAPFNSNVWQSVAFGGLNCWRSSFFVFFWGGGGEIGKKGRWAKATPKVRDAAWTTARQTGWNEWLPKFWGGLRIRSNVAANLPLFGKVWHLEGWTAGEALPSPNKKARTGIRETNWSTALELEEDPGREWLRGGTPVGVPCLKFLKWMLAYQQNSITQTTQNINNKT